MIGHKMKEFLMISVLTICGISALNAQNKLTDDVDIKWRASPAYNAKDNLDLQLIIRNKSNRIVDLKKSDLWFNSMFPVLEKQTEQFVVTSERGNLFRVQFKQPSIKPQDSLVIEYTTQYAISNISTAPNGFYFQDKGQGGKYEAVHAVHYESIRLPKDQQNQWATALYDKNALLNKEAKASLIFPTPKSIKSGRGSFVLPQSLTYHIVADYSDALQFLQSIPSFRQVAFVSTDEKSAKLNIRKVTGLKDEAYRLFVDKSGIRIESSSQSGVFYAIQSLRSLLVQSQEALPFVEVNDEPRYVYRGLMMDIARNFRDKETILKYLDVMAANKLNVFHLHFSDDEGWRIEIPGLPELTEVGANRSPLFNTGAAIQPAYGSGGVSTQGAYLRVADFVEILKYAHERHITVVPEIETPGHARASIKAMEARYQKFIKQGKKQEAERYLLYDHQDQSVYSSVQHFNDNVINPALPSTYAFMEKVIDELAAMYKEAGVTFKKVSIGGDEVPSGVWERSPKAQQLMAEKGFKSVHELWPYYIEKVHDICAVKGVELAGWEEIGMVNQGKGMVVNPAMKNKGYMQVDVWNNVIGGGQEDLAYRLANAGYKTVLISASNMYLDMMWNRNFSEPGLKWATYADLYHAYSLLPEDYFANIATYYSGKPLGKEHFKHHVRLNEKGRSNFLGIKGGIWSETILSTDHMDYLVFPRFFTLAERAWSSRKDYESESSFSTQKFNEDYTRFINRLGYYELPNIASKFAFRLPAVGVKEDKGYLKANLEYPGFNIYYTLDGSAPTLQSAQYDVAQPIKIETGQMASFAVIDSNGRVGQISYFTK